MKLCNKRKLQHEKKYMSSPILAVVEEVGSRIITLMLTDSQMNSQMNFHSDLKRTYNLSYKNNISIYLWLSSTEAYVFLTS